MSKFSEKLDKHVAVNVAVIVARGVRELEAEAAMGVILGNSILLARLVALEAVVAAVRVVVSCWLPIEQGSTLSAGGVDLLKALKALDGKK